MKADLPGLRFETAFEQLVTMIVIVASVCFDSVVP